MFARFHAQLHEVRLDLRERKLRHRERLALRRRGEEVARAGAVAAGSDAVPLLIREIAECERRASALAAELGASLDADRADVCAVAAGVKPAVVLRGLCTRLVLRHRQSLERRALQERLEALGALATGSAESGAGPLGGEVGVVRGELTAVASEREGWGAPYGGRALPQWTAGAGAEGILFGRAVLAQLRAHLLPKAPALAGLAAGWWIANTYTDSYLRSGLRSLGLGSGGTRVVSSSTYEAMTFWLPLLAAALCAYLGERLGSYYRRRRSADT